MNDIFTDWKKEYILGLEASLAFFSRPSKFEREKWVARRLVSALAIDFSDEEFTSAEEPADVAFRNAHFQIKEILNEGRKRTKEIKDKLVAAKSAQKFSDVLEHYSPMEISFAEIVNSCSEYVNNIANQYGTLERKQIDLICYFNLVDYHEGKPTEFTSNNHEFRSFSVVSNQFCAVINALYNAPSFLLENRGQVMKLY